MYTIVVRNRIYRFKTIEDAKQAAADLFRRTGIVAGIEAAKAKRTRVALASR